MAGNFRICIYNNEKLNQNVHHQFFVCSSNRPPFFDIPIVWLIPESLMYLTNICNNLLSVECLPDIKVIYTVKEH